ncbi:hypothetical protein ACER0C_010865 [Sarotherodon galilaeus]
MDPAAFSPPRELQEAVINSASKLINQWLEHEREASLYTVEANLQHLISSYPWLLDSLHPLVQNFVLHELHLHPPAATARPLASMEDVPSDPPDEELPGPSEPSPRRKRRSRHRRGTPQPDVGTCKQSAFSAASDSVTVFSGAIFCVSSEDNNKFFVSPMAIAPKTAFAEPTFRVNDCVHAVPGVTEFSTMSLGNEYVRGAFSSASVPSGKAINFTETVFSDHIPPSTPSPQFHVGSVTQLAVQLAVQSAALLPPVQSAALLPPVQSPLAQQPTHSFIQSPSSPSHYEQGTHFTTTSAGSLKLAISETVTPSRASPEAGCQSPANSGPLEVKTPAPAASLENFTEQSQPSSPAESSSEFALLPPSSAGCIGEHFQPSEDCIPLLLPESSHCAAQSQPVSTLAEVSVPAASVSVSAGGPEEPVQPQVSSAGGSGEPSQLQVSSAGGSGEPSQHPASSAGGPEEPSQPQVSSAGGPESPVQPQVSLAGGSGEPNQRPASLAGGPEEPVQPQVSSAGGSGAPSQSQVLSAGGPEKLTQHHASSAVGPGGPSQHIPMSADGSGKTVQPPPVPPPAASTSRPAASTSPPAAVSLPSGSAAVSLPSGSAAVSLPSGSAAVSLPSSTPGPASVSSSTPGPASMSSSTPGPASVSSSTPGPASVSSSSPGPISVSSSSPGPASSGPASSGPAVATPSLDPARPVPPRLCRPFSTPLSWHHGCRGRPPERVRRRRWHRGRPPDLLSGPHCLPNGRPPDWFCLRRRRCRVHGPPPELFARRRRCCPHGRPPELFMDSCWALVWFCC